MVDVLTQTIPLAGAWRAGTVSSDTCDDLDEDEAEEAGAEADDAGAEAGADFDAGAADFDEVEAVDAVDAEDDVDADFAAPLTTTIDEIFEIVEAETPAFERSETDE